MTPSNTIDRLTRMVNEAETVRLFLDYDGTLAKFAPSPDTVIPDAEVISLLTRLVGAEGILPAVISGRRLAHIQKLLPIKGLLMAGTYGIETQMPDGHLQHHSGMPFDVVRPMLDNLLERWQKLIADRTGFYIEDKGWTLAMHGSFSTHEVAEPVLAAALIEAQSLHPGDGYRLMGGDRFLELAPKEANKTEAVNWILNEFTPPNALIIYLGDDDKDEEAFEALLAAGGYAVRISAAPVETIAQYRLENPRQVRDWLGELLNSRSYKI